MLRQVVAPSMGCHIGLPGPLLPRIAATRSVFSGAFSGNLSLYRMWGLAARLELACVAVGSPHTLQGMYASPMDLSTLYRKPVFRSRSPQAAQRELCRAITAHDLRWGQGAIETALFRHELGGVSVMALRYGAEVEVRPQAFQDFTLVQMPLRGMAEFESDGVALGVAPGEVAVLSPQRSVRLLWQRGCEQLIVKVPHRLLTAVLADARAARPHGLAGQAPEASLVLPPAFKLPDSLISIWQGLVQQCLNLPGHESGSALHPLWLQQFERVVALFLLSHQPAVVLPPVEAAAPALPRTDAVRLERLESHVQRHLGAALTLEDLARAAGVSPRLLHLICQRCHGVAPMTWLRQRRLDAARAALLANPERGVTDVALECGFTHLGRFSAYYRERFGELPSATAWVRA